MLGILNDDQCSQALDLIISHPSVSKILMNDDKTFRIKCKDLNILESWMGMYGLHLVISEKGYRIASDVISEEFDASGKDEKDEDESAEDIKSDIETAEALKKDPKTKKMAEDPEAVKEISDKKETLEKSKDPSIRKEASDPDFIQKIAELYNEDDK